MIAALIVSTEAETSDIKFAHADADRWTQAGGPTLD